MTLLMCQFKNLAEETPKISKMLAKIQMGQFKNE